MRLDAAIIHIETDVKNLAQSAEVLFFINKDVKSLVYAYDVVLIKRANVLPVEDVRTSLSIHINVLGGNYT